MNPSEYRVSQRRPQACQECTRRKRKCDKQLPCGRCRRLKLDCTRETVRLRNLSTKHADEISFLESLRRDFVDVAVGGQVNRDYDHDDEDGHRAAGSVAAGPVGSVSVGSIVQKIDDRIGFLQFGTAVASVASPRVVRQDSETTSHLPSEEPMDQVPSSSGGGGGLGNGQDAPFQPPLPQTATAASTSIIEAKDTDASILTALEYMAWGRSFGGCYPHLTCACHHHRGFHVRLGGDASNGSSSGGIGGSRSLQRLGPGLPKAGDARRLVEFHLRHLAWHHNCLHAPTFFDKCEVFWQTGRFDHPQWLAAYLAVLSSTVYCVQNSQKFSHQLGIDLSLLSSKKLFTDMLDVLYSEDFLGDVSLYSVQAIVISTEVAHNLGFSQLNAILIGSAIRIAQCLGLHKIESRGLSVHETPERWNELVDLEVGKRVWCQMVIQDLFAIPFNDTYGILPPYCSTDLPLNCDDDLISRDPGTPTVSSYCRVLAQLALIMPELAEGLGPVKKRKSLQHQYDHVLRMDQKMREMVRQIPSFLLREDPKEQSRVPWLSIARRSLAITAADKIIMIHRPFLFRSFQSPTYAYTRRTCVAAAMTILREHEAIASSDDLSIWTHSAFCITAAVILCFEVSYRVSTRDGDVEPYRRAIQAARDRLVARREDVLASRGVTLIDVISLEETAFGKDASTSDSSPKIIDLPRVVENFFAVNKFDTHHDSASSILTSSPFEVCGEVNGQFLDGVPMLPSMYDFDEWYNNTFNEGNVYTGDFV